MKAWLKSFVSRIGDLIIKMISIKGLFAIGMTYIAIRVEGAHGTIAYTVLAWGLLIGFREVQKFYTMMFGGQLPGQTPVASVLDEKRKGGGN